MDDNNSLIYSDESVNPLTRTVNVYDLEKEELTDLYSFDDDIQVCIYDDLTINITELLKQ